MNVQLLDEAATLAATLTDDDPRRAVVAALVDELEAAANIGWDDAGGRASAEPVVVLLRRFDRARRLLGAPTPALIERVESLTAALRDPVGALLGAWAAYQDLRVIDAPLDERLAAHGRLVDARVRVGRV